MVDRASSFRVSDPPSLYHETPTFNSTLLRFFRWGDWSDYVNNVSDLGGFETGLSDMYQPNT